MLPIIPILVFYVCHTRKKLSRRSDIEYIPRNTGKELSRRSEIEYKLRDTGKKLSRRGDTEYIPHEYCRETIYCESYNKSLKYVQGSLEWELSRGALIKTISNHGAVVLPSGLVIDGAGEAHTFNRWYWRRPAKNQLAKLASQAVSAAGNEVIFSFIQIYQESFQHVVFDTLPKLSFSCAFLVRNMNVRILIASKIQRDLIQETCPGLDSKRFVMMGKKPIFAAKIFVPQFFPPLQMGMTQKGIMQTLNADRQRKPKSEDYPHFYNLSIAPIETRRKARALYLPRPKGRPRSVMNELEMLRLVRERLPYVNVDVASLTNDWRTDRYLFQDVDVIFGPHGGAFANIIFAKNASSVLEFLPLKTLKNSGRNARPCYIGLALSLNLTYRNIEPATFSFEGPMRVDPVEVVESLATLTSTAMRS